MKKNKKKKSKSSAGERAQSRGFSGTITASKNLEADIEDLKECLLAFKTKYTNQVLMCGWFLHNKDIYTPEQIEKFNINAKAGDLKPAHFHFSILLSAKKDLKSIEKLFQQFGPNQYTAGKIVMNKNCYSGRFANEKDFANRMKYGFHGGDENRGKTIYSYAAAKAKTTFIYGITGKTFEKYISFQSKELIESETFDDEFEEGMKVGFQIRTGKLDLKNCEMQYGSHGSKHKKYFCDCFADYVESFQKPRNHKCNVFFFGEGGTGKTFLCNYLAEKIFEKSKVYSIDDLKAGFNGLRTETCLIFNDVNATGDNSIKQNLSLQVFKNINDLHNQSMRVKVLYKTIRIFPEMCFGNCSEKANLFFEKLCAKSCEITTDEGGNEKKIGTAENKKQFTRRFPGGGDTEYYDDGENMYVVFSLMNGDFISGNGRTKNKIGIKGELDEDNNATAETLAKLREFGNFLFTCGNEDVGKFEGSKLNFKKLKLKTDRCFIGEEHYYFS